MIDPKKDALRIMQPPLLDLGPEEDAPGGFVPPEEANRISEMARMALEQLRPGGTELNQEPRWMGDYRRLREAGWPWRVACYIAWASSPRRDRRPRSQDELAREYLGLTSDRQITQWRKRNPLIMETITMLQAAPLLEHRRDIYDALVESALNPDYKGHQDRELALKLLGDYSDKKDLRISGNLSGKDVTQRSDEELRALTGEIAAEEAESPACETDDDGAPSEW